MAGIDSIFKDSNCYFKMLSIHYLSVNKIIFQQFSTIFKDKGTIKGIYNIYKSIFLDQLSLYILEDLTKVKAVHNNFYN